MKYFLQRVLMIIPVLFLASVIIFSVIHFIPGDPAEILAGPGVPQSEIENIRRVMNLDKPLVTQYFMWLTNILRGDFGTSYVSGEPVLPLVLSRFENTIKLALLGIGFAVLVGIPMGVLAAVKQNSFFDLFVMGLSIVGISIPLFWLGLLLIMFFSVQLGLLPVSFTGTVTWKHMILPTITLGANSLAVIARMTRSSMLEVLRQDYIRTAESKGLPTYKIIIKHALKNALIPVITTIGIQFGYLLGGAVLTETVFAYSGLGRLLIDSIKRYDYLVVQACMLLITGMFIIINLLVDLAYSVLDPRIRYDK